MVKNVVMFDFVAHCQHLSGALEDKYYNLPVESDLLDITNYLILLGAEVGQKPQTINE